MSLIEQLKKRKTLILKEPLVVRLRLTRRRKSSSSSPVRVIVGAPGPVEEYKRIPSRV